MRSFKSKKLAFIILAVSLFTITSCDNIMSPHSKGDLSETEYGETRLLVVMHGNTQPRGNVRAAVNSGNSNANNGNTGNGAAQEIQALILTVRQMVVIDSNGNHITILDEDRTMDILAVSRADPVVLSNVTIEPGSYKELRLVLKDENIIRVDGVEHPIKVPSGEQSGLKLKGPFVIPKGKLFTLYIELDTDKSVHWNQGQGWMLKPVLSISNGSEVVGVFRGNLTLSGNIGAGETLVQLYADNTARMRVASFPSYTVWADYNYNSLTKNLNLTGFDLDAPGLGSIKKKKAMEKFPNQITLPVKQWSLDDIIVIDANGIAANLYRVEDFSFSPGSSFTEFILNVDYPDASKSGKYVVSEVRFIDTGMPPQTVDGVLDGSRSTVVVPILNDYIQGASTRIQITSYLFDKPEDINTVPAIYANRYTELMAGSVFSETTANPWQSPATFTLLRADNSGPEQEFTVSFTSSMNIRMDHGNFTNNNPVISWNPYPGANNGYLVLVVTDNKNYNPTMGKTKDNYPYVFAFYKNTTSTSVVVESDLISFTQEGSNPPQINKGDHMRIGVYVLDGSGYLDTMNFTGAIFMDSAIIERR